MTIKLQYAAGRGCDCGGTQPFKGFVINRGENLKEVSYELGFEYMSVLRVANGKAVPRPEFIKAISEHLGMDPPELFTSRALHPVMQEPNPAA